MARYTKTIFIGNLQGLRKRKLIEILTNSFVIFFIFV